MKNVLNTLKTLKSVATGYAQELADEALVEAKGILDEAKKARINTQLKDQIDLNDLAHNIREVNKANGWGIKEPSEHQKMVQLMLIVTEVAEAAEAYRKDDEENLVEELADVIIRTLDMAAYWDYDIDKAVKDKIEKNKTRSYRHGGKKV